MEIMPKNADICVEITKNSRNPTSLFLLFSTFSLINKQLGVILMTLTEPLDFSSLIHLSFPELSAMSCTSITTRDDSSVPMLTQLRKADSEY